MAGQFAGKAVFITGGASGIGKATAEAFAREGARLALADLNEEAGTKVAQSIRSAGGEALFTRCDVSRSAEVQAAIEAAVSAYGRLDCAFNNAGNNSPSAHIHDYPEDAFEALVRVHILGMFHCTKYEFRQMVKQGGGAIVNTASTAGLMGSPKRVGYSAAKHGIVGLTRSAGCDGAEFGIRVNAVCPGLIETPFTVGDIGDAARVQARAKAAHPIGRAGQPEEVAAAVLFLCSEAAAMITGATLAIDGGWTASLK